MDAGPGVRTGSWLWAEDSLARTSMTGISPLPALCLSPPADPWWGSPGIRGRSGCCWARPSQPSLQALELLLRAGLLFCRPVAALTPKPQVVAGSSFTHLLRAKRASPVPWRHFLSPDPVPAEAAALTAVLSSRERHSSHTSLPAWHLRATSQHLLSFCLWEPECPHSSARPTGTLSSPIAVRVRRGTRAPIAVRVW